MSMTVIPRSSIAVISLSTSGREAARPREERVPVPKPSFDHAGTALEVAGLRAHFINSYVQDREKGET